MVYFLFLDFIRMTTLQSWGKYPLIDSSVYTFPDPSTLRQILSDHDNIIAHGNGRSYGDSALASQLVHVRPYNYYLDFDRKTGILHCQAGVLLSEIIDTFLPQGWFLAVTPGTRYITVGGALASDVHGKNHHIHGSFSDTVLDFTLMLADGSITTCSHSKNSTLFRASCGGMGLTGVILNARIKLVPVRSCMISQTTIKTKNLKETFDAFEQYRDSTYSVAWIDCLAKKDTLGRCILMVGEHCEDDNLNFRYKQKFTIPFEFPSFSLNKLTVKAFNTLYYNKVRKRTSEQKVSIGSFFYPLDAIDHWNRIYGKGGFTQYQFILPLARSYDGLQEILSHIARSGKGSFLAVLKLFGKGNSNYLSFPMTGYSLALDFKIEPGLFELLDELDAIVLKYEGRLYLAKDVRVTRDVFEVGYPEIDTFRTLRTEYSLAEKFNSLQSIRVGI